MMDGKTTTQSHARSCGCTAFGTWATWYSDVLAALRLKQCRSVVIQPTSPQTLTTGGMPCHVVQCPTRCAAGVDLPRNAHLDRRLLQGLRRGSQCVLRSRQLSLHNSDLVQDAEAGHSSFPTALAPDQRVRGRRIKKNFVGSGFRRELS